MKKLFSLLLASMLLAFLLGCSPADGGETAVESSETAQESESHGDEDHDENEEDHGENEEDHDEHEDEHHDDEDMILLPEFSAVALDGRALSVVATTSIVGDIVAQVGGDAIELTVLMDSGQDPHSYEPAARDLTAVASADIIWINGWDLEEALIHDLEEIVEEGVLVAISAEIEPLPFEDDHEDDHGEEGEEGAEAEEEGHEGHGHGAFDPHVWFNIQHVKQWVSNVVEVLSELDPENSDVYGANGEAYTAELDRLAADVATEIDQIPADARQIVTNHDSFSYFAEAYDFVIVGTVLSSASTVAEPSASDLADLIGDMNEAGTCVIFAETTANTTLTETVAGELNQCDEVQVLSLYTGALGVAGSGAENYIDMYRANVETIVSGLGY